MRRLSIKIDNRTKYSTRSLRVLFAAVLRRHLKTHDRPRLVDVRVKSSRTGRVRGYAWLDSGSVVMYLPPAKYKPSTQTVAYIFNHELLHCVGLSSHKEPAFVELHERDFSYADAYKLEVDKPAKREPKSVDTKVTALKARRKRWLSKLLRAHRAIKKIDKSLKYYAKKGAQK